MDKKCLVIEDDFGFYLQTELILKQLGYAQIDNAVSVAEIQRFVANQSYDLLISDIVLENGETSFDYFENHPTDIPTIFVSALNDESIYDKIQKGKKHIFLVKPVNQLSLKSAIEFLKNMDNFNAHSTNDMILLKDGGTSNNIKLQNIHYIEADGNYCTFYLQNQKITTREKLSTYLEKLNQHEFIQTHKSYIVNLNEINSANFPKNSLIINDSVIPIGRTYKEVFKQAYLKKFS